MKEKKFHINKNTGKLVPCNATVRACPRQHFNSMEEYNEFMLKENTPKSLLEQYYELKDSVKIVKDEETGLTTLSYLHAGVDFSNPLLRMARGLTLDSNGNIITRGFQKFFNYLQLENYESYSDQFKREFANIKATPDIILECREKMDGSLAITGIYNGELVVSTTSSTNNDYAKKIKGLIEKDPELRNIVLREAQNGRSICFEYLGAENEIVVKYDFSEKLSYLASVDKITGKRTVDEKLAKELESRGVLMPTVYRKSLKEVLHDLKTLKNFEGYVVTNEYGNLIKFKTEDWFELANSVEHDVLFSNKVTKGLIQKVTEVYSEDKMDDLLAIVNKSNKKTKPILDIYNKIQEAEAKIEEYANKYRAQTFTPELGKEISRETGIYSAEVFRKMRNSEHKINQLSLYKLLTKLF